MKTKKATKRPIKFITLSYKSDGEYTIDIARKTRRQKAGKKRTYTVRSCNFKIIDSFTFLQWSKKVNTTIHFGVYPSIHMTIKEL